MAFELAFTTEDYDKGKSLLIVDACTDWASVPAVDSVTFTISSMYSEVVIGDDPLYTATVTVPIATVAFEEGFQYELTGAQIFGVGYDDTIPNSIYTIKMDLYNGAALVGQSIPVYYSKAKVFNITYAVNKDNVFQYTLTATAADNNQKERLGDCQTLTLNQAGQKGPNKAVAAKCW